MNIIERDDGTLVLPIHSDPVRKRAVGYRRYWLGLDLGRNDPSALVLIRDEQIPEWGQYDQELGERQRSIVWTDRIRDTAYTDIVDYVQRIMTRPAIARRVNLAIDATGLGGPFSDFLTARQIPHAAITITGGEATSRKGHVHHVAKNALIGGLANAMEQRHLTVAHDLPECDQLKAEFAAIEVKVTTAGNSVLVASAADHHSDLAIAAALAWYHSGNAPGRISVSTVKI